MVDGAGDRRVKPLITLISEVYDNPNANEVFEMELDRALEEGITVIVIEPTRLGDETARWIAFGNCLHKTAVLAGMGSIVTAFIWTDKPYFCLPLGILSILCTSIYTLSWQFDPCVKYQVETDFTKLFAEYPQLSLLSTSPVILVRKDNSRRKMLHSGISIVATIFCIWRLYDAYKMTSLVEYGKVWLSKSVLWWILGSVCLPVFIPLLICQYINYLKYKSLKKKLAGKVVLITGASSGLGEAFAHVFYKAGCRIILSSRNETELARVRKMLLLMHQTTTTYMPVLLPLDLSQIDSLPQKAKIALDIYGHIDILINNGGISYRGNVIDTNINVDMNVMLVNYFGQVALTKAILPSMIHRKEGHIVAVSSVQGLIGIPHRSAYAASKHALQGFCDSLRAEVARHNVKVTVISPGYIKTKLSINSITGDGKQYGVMDATTAGGYEPSDVAEMSLKAILQEKNEIIISTTTPRLAIIIRNILPWLYFRIMEQRAKKFENSKK